MVEVDTNEMAALQEQWTKRWHEDAVEVDVQAGNEDRQMESLVRQVHRANFALWHEEDKARDPGATDAEIARVKRAIDGFNQVRNDGVERIDEWLVERMGAGDAGGVLHSETPGMMLDRLSILSLKIFHTEEEVDRAAATEAHRERNRQRLVVLREQRADLTTALGELMRAVRAGERRIKVYRQMKMYNDPELNPRVYGARAGLTRRSEGNYKTETAINGGAREGEAGGRRARTRQE